MQELRKGLLSLSSDLTDEDIEFLIDDADQDKNGMIDLAEVGRLQAATTKVCTTMY